MLNNLNRRKGYTEVLYNYKSEKFFTDAVGNQFQELNLKLDDGGNAGGNVPEKDPIFIDSPAFNITSDNITNWNSAYGWGNHADGGYLTSVPTLEQVTAQGNKTNSQIDIQNNGSYAITLNPAASINTNSGIGLDIGNYGTNSWRAQIDGTTGDVTTEGQITSSKLKISTDGTDKGSLTITDVGDYSEIRFQASDGSEQSIIQGVNANLYLYSGSEGFISLNTFAVFDRDGNAIFNNGGAGTTLIQGKLTASNGVSVNGDLAIANLSIRSEQEGNPPQGPYNAYIDQDDASGGVFYLSAKSGPILLWCKDSRKAIAFRTGENASIRTPLTVDHDGITVKGRLTVDGMTQLANVESLPATNNELGDVCVLTTDNKPYFYDGSSWREMSLI